MKYSKQAWAQVKGKTCDELISALLKDGFQQDEKTGPRIVFRHQDGRRVAIDYHPNKTYGPNLLKALLDDIGWSEADMRRLKFIK